MALDGSQSHEIDLDRTDRLPILEGVMFDPDVEDDAVVMEPPSGLAPSASRAIPVAPADFARPPVDLPSLAETVRSVEERIARQTAEYEQLSRSYEKARDAEAAALARANALSAELAAAQTALAVEQHRVREMERSVAERNTAVEAMRARAEEALRVSERYQTEARTTRDALAARDATIVQVLHSLGERDAQLHALQREHAQVVPALEARSQAGLQLEAELAAARSRSEAIALELKKAQQAATAQAARIKQGEAELHATRQDLSTLKKQANTYLELLRTREWRHGFDANQFREWDAKVGAATAGQGALQAERERLQQTTAALSGRVVEQDETIAKLQKAAAAEADELNKKTQELQAGERARADLAARLDALEGERKRLKDELAAREAALAAARTQATSESQRAKELAAQIEKVRAEERAHAAKLHAEERAQVAKLHAEERAQAEKLHAEQRARLERGFAEQRAQAEKAFVELRTQSDKAYSELRAQSDKARTEHAARIAELKAQAETHEQELAVLMAHLNEARRPIQSFQADVKQLSDELALKNASIEQLTEDNRNLRATLERTRGALEEREFLIRRLERSESNNANVLGRIQTTMEKLGAAPPVMAAPAVAPECTAEFIRIDGEITYPLGRRTRIGRAPGCELQVDASSVSRHHALLLKGARELIIEDLNSTNGVVVNGRKVSRQLLADGDLVVIGDVQFRCVIRSAPAPQGIAEASTAAQVAAPPRPAEANAAEPRPPGPASGT